MPKNGSKSSVTAEKSVDRVLIAGRTEDGQGLKILRHRHDRLELGVAQPLKEGKAIQGEVVRLKPHKNFPLLCDVEVQVPSTATAVDRKATAVKVGKGPAKVSTEQYRRNWQSIFGSDTRNSDSYLN